MSAKPVVVIGLLGPTLDHSPKSPMRWERWRPTVSLAQQQHLIVNRFELLHQPEYKALAEMVSEDIVLVSPETSVRQHVMPMADAWDFEEVYAALHDFVRSYRFDPESEDYLVHITTGTHVAQICLFLLTESRHIPGRLLQTSPPSRKRSGSAVGECSVIDLDLSRYDRLASRFQVEKQEATSFLKSGIETRNPAFNQLIDEIERVAINSRSPILLQGPTGVGKSQLARRIYELKQSRRQVEGTFVAVNCATLRGDAAMSALFGHKRGAFTGALNDRPGLLKTANDGMVFLDEIGELGLDEQAMLLHAVEEKRFFPVGADKEVASDFQLICGTNRDLEVCVSEGTFREDLLARINLWTFRLPGLSKRPEDIEPNLAYEFEQFARIHGSRVSFNSEAREKYLAFATGAEARWLRNFRDLNGSVTRMATLSKIGRITIDEVHQEVNRLKKSWSADGAAAADSRYLDQVFARAGEAAVSIDEIDLFDQAQLVQVIGICRESKTLSEAGRKLFAASRTGRKSTNDADRLRKYLARFGLQWSDLS